MTNHLVLLKNMARDMAKKMPIPAFYLDFGNEVSYSWDAFFDNPVIVRLQEDVLTFLYDDAMFGIEHSKKVAQDASTLILLEESVPIERRRELAILAQVCGLLHDIEREEGDVHAEKAADTLTTVIRDYPFPDRDKNMVAQAVLLHEDLDDTNLPADHETAMLSRALYDADKFRFGLDIFATILWLYCDYEEWDLPTLSEHFPWGLQQAERIAKSFRTDIGKQYGPEMIELGITLGRRMAEEIKLLAAKTSSGS